jgi:signal transduction histidine kinase
MSISLGERLMNRWPRLPRRTLRLRLTLVYSGLFLVSGAALLAIMYVLLAHQYTGRFFITTGGRGVTNVIVQSARAGQSPGVVGGTVSKTFDPSGITGPPSKTAILAAGNAQSTAARRQLLIQSGIALGIMGVLSVWLGWVVSGRALRPLRTIASAAREISASNLHRRLVLEGPDDELRQLGTTFNDLLARLEAAFATQRSFVSNASHELRTPLTLERALIEVALADPNTTVEKLRQTCEQVLAAGEQQERLIESLLTLSRSQRGLDRREPVDLATIAATTVRSVERNGVGMTTALSPARTAGDARLLERLIANLVGNALRYNVPGGSVELTTETLGERAVLTVVNSGPVVPPRDVDRLFEPFQRLESGRSAAAGGTGLGLSIVAAIAGAHDATVSASARPEGGLRIEVGFAARA